MRPSVTFIRPRYADPVTALAVGTPAPAIPRVALGSDGPLALFFYKVTCPVCQLAAPKVQGFEEAYPGHIVGIGQDPPEKLGGFEREFGMSFRSVPDLPPYATSNAYGIEVVPTLFLIDPQGSVAAVAESWDRQGFNDISEQLAGLLGATPRPISVAGDGLPSFRPG